MPSGKTHEKVNIILLIPIMYLIGLNKINFILSLGFGLAYLFCTFYVTPDKDLVIPFMRHRGISHSVIAWCILFVVGYHYIGIIAIGSTIPIFLHIIVDRIVTKVKRAI